MSEKYRVEIPGATGMVGQRFVQLLAERPRAATTRFAVRPAQPI